MDRALTLPALCVSTNHDCAVFLMDHIDIQRSFRSFDRAGNEAATASGAGVGVDLDDSAVFLFGPLKGNRFNGAMPGTESTLDIFVQAAKLELVNRQTDFDVILFVRLNSS